MKSPLTPAGIEPATFRIVAQHLNHCATAVAPNVGVDLVISIVIRKSSGVLHRTNAERITGPTHFVNFEGSTKQKSDQIRIISV